jgi:hypothetical protein
MLKARGWVAGLMIAGFMAAACDNGDKEEGADARAEEKSKKKRKPDKEAPSATAAASATQVAAPAPPPASTAASTAAPAASANATPTAIAPSAAPEPASPGGWHLPDEPSKAPTVAEWDSAPDDSNTTARALGCEVKFVREWIRVSCRSAPGDENPIQGVRVLSPARKPAGFLDFVRADSVASFVYPIRNTIDLRVEFNWKIYNRTLTLKYAKGVGKPVVAFESLMPTE